MSTYTVTFVRLLELLSDRRRVLVGIVFFALAWNLSRLFASMVAVVCRLDGRARMENDNVAGTGRG